MRVKTGDIENIRSTSGPSAVECRVVNDSKNECYSRAHFNKREIKMGTSRRKCRKENEKIEIGKASYQGEEKKQSRQARFAMNALRLSRTGALRINTYVIVPTRNIT